MNKKKQLESLKNKRQELINELYDEKDKCQNNLDRAVAECNNDVNILNSVRISVYGTISKLYEFLNKYGNVKHITSLDAENEKIFSKRLSYKKYEDGIPSEENNNKSRYKNAAKVAFALLIPEVTLPALAIDGIVKVIKGSKERKLQIAEYITENDEIKKGIDSLKNQTNQQIKQYKDAREIIKIYQSCIIDTENLIKNKVFPEFDAVCCFLMAESAIETIICDDEDNCRTELYNKRIDIKKLGTSTNPQHKKFYTFFENTVAYYELICAFFTKTIIKDMTADGKISKKEKDDFNNDIKKINESKENIEHTIVLTSGR